MTPTATLAIRRDDGLADYERHLQQPDLGRRVLVLPKNIRGGGPLGLSVGLAQLVLTWAQGSEAPRTRTYIDKGNDIAYGEFVSPLFGFAAAYFSDFVTPRRHNDNIRADLMRSSAGRIHAMSKGDLEHTAKGSKVEFILVHRARSEFHSLLYKQTPTPADLMDREVHGRLVVEPSGMNHLLWRCIGHLNFPKTSKQLAYLTRLLNHNNNPLGQVLYESFKNTAEHAYLDIKGRRSARGMRSVTIAAQKVDRDQFKSSAVISSDQPAASDYFERLRRQYRAPRRRKHIEMLEISILDSGPGLAKTILRTCPHREPLDDIQLVARCFRKHKTAKPGPSSGIGLNRILELIHELNGFMRLRTSTTESFFAGGPDYNPTMPPIDFIQGDLASVQGTSLMIGLPIVC